MAVFPMLLVLFISSARIIVDGLKSDDQTTDVLMVENTTDDSADDDAHDVTDHGDTGTHETDFDEDYLNEMACYQDLMMGNCSDPSMRYFWNISSFACEEFEYSGCDANGNNFETMDECEDTCDPFHQSQDGHESYDDDMYEDCDLICPDGECKMDAGRCDGKSDCSGGEDEEDCPPPVQCFMCVSVNMPSFMMEDENGHKRRSLRFRREDGMDEDHEMMMMENHACERGDAEALMPMMCSGQCVQVGFTMHMFNEVGYMMYRACKHHILPWSPAENKCYDKDALYDLAGEHERMPWPREMTTKAQAKFCDENGCNSKPMKLDNFCGLDMHDGKKIGPDMDGKHMDGMCALKCKNGDCMKEGGRCDGEEHCSDGSDEDDCGKKIKCYECTSVDLSKLDMKKLTEEMMKKHGMDDMKDGMKDMEGMEGMEGMMEGMKDMEGMEGMKDMEGMDMDMDMDMEMEMDMGSPDTKCEKMSKGVKETDCMGQCIQTGFTVNFGGKEGYMFERSCMKNQIPWKTMKDGCHGKSDMMKAIDMKTFPFKESDVKRMDAIICSSGLCNDEPMNKKNFCGSVGSDKETGKSDLKAGQESGASRTFAHCSHVLSLVFTTMYMCL